ncbi:hypothetical protein PC122_g9514 [Phytophthora cactorum]|nr:hypothetical protein PC122_g9514 [Phytophthora cactorum]
MVELRIARPQISAVLRPGVIDVLTIIPVDQIADKGIRFFLGLGLPSLSNCRTYFKDLFPVCWRVDHHGITIYLCLTVATL